MSLTKVAQREPHIENLFVDQTRLILFDDPPVSAAWGKQTKSMSSGVRTPLDDVHALLA
jgi:hypothetical protein